MLKPIDLLRSASEIEEIDYSFVNGILQDYASPRDVITRMLRSGELIRIKKGIYVFGNRYAKRPFSLEVLANMIYGPSYVSCEYALSFYGLIPEAVHEVCSMTPLRNKSYTTPVARFSYRYLNKSKYIAGVTNQEITPNIFAQIATPEKALADTLYRHHESALSIQVVKKILFDDYRIDPNELKQLSIGGMTEIAKHYQNATISLLPKIIREVKRD